MGASNGNLIDSALIAQPDCWEIVSHSARAIAHVGRVGAQTQLAITIAAPSLDGAVVQQGTGVGASSSKLHSSAPGAQVHCWQGIAHLARAPAPVECVTQTQLAGDVASPALEGVIVQQGAGVCVSSSEEHNSAPNTDHRQGISHLPRAAALGVSCVAKAQLTVVIVAPALCRAAFQQGTGV